jgi:hypothetical protein
MALAAHDAGQVAPYGFAEFERRAARGRAAARARKRRTTTLAAAVTVFALVGGTWRLAMRPGAPVTTASRIDGAVSPATREITAERWLAATSVEPVVVRAGSYAAVVALEDRLAFIDDRLNDSRVAGNEHADAVALGHERTRLVNALASVRYAQALAASFQ